MKPYYDEDGIQIYHGDSADVLRTLPGGMARTCVTSPPYWGLRDYGVDGQLGMESTPEEYVENMVNIFREVRRTLRDDGTLWLNLGDSYWGGKGKNGSSKARATAEERGYSQSGGTVQIATRPQDLRHQTIKQKDLIGIPWMVAFALRADGWYLRSDIIWHKPNPMPESVTDRPTKAHEYLFLLSKGPRYAYDSDAIREPLAANTLRECSIERPMRGDSMQSSKGADGSYTMRVDAARGANKRSVWTVATQPFSGAHFATFPPKLIEPCIKAGSAEDDIVLDPFNGSGTTGAVAQKWGRRYVGIELNADYIELSKRRVVQRQLFAGLEVA